MIAKRGELLFDGYARWGIVLDDIHHKPKILERKIVVTHPYIGISMYVCDITTRAWYRIDPSTGQCINIFSNTVIPRPV